MVPLFDDSFGIDEANYNYETVNLETGEYFQDVEGAIHEIWLIYIDWAWADREPAGTVSNFSDIVDYDEYKGICTITDTSDTDEKSGWELSLEAA